ncbi:MAG: ice-binding family protein [Adhaeribacter sp.]
MKYSLITLLLLALASYSLHAQNKPDLGTLSSYSVLANTGLLDNDNTDIQGDAGVYPANMVKGFSPLKIKGKLEIASPKAQQAQLDLVQAYNFLERLSSTNNLTGKSLKNKTLGPGVYKFDAEAVLDGELTLDHGGNPDATFIFQVEKDLVLEAGASVSFAESAKPRIQNVFWQVKGNASLGAGSTFQGSLLARKDITAASGTLVQGRLLTSGGQVQVSDAQINFPTDLALSMSKSSGSSQDGIYFIGETITFTLKAQNLGPVNGATVWVRAPLPAGITYVSSRASAAAYDAASATWTLAELPSGSSETLEITGRINALATEFLTFSASIAGHGMEEILQNNGGTLTGICVAPASPGSIQGPAAVCSGSSDNVFRVDPVPGVMSYDWKVPAGWAILSGHFTPSITVKAGSNPGTVSLKVGNVCLSLTTQKSVAVNTARPEMPAAISTSAARPCSGQSGILYSVAPVAGAATYIWEVPEGWTITAGAGKPAITVTAGRSDGTVTVKAANGCGISETQSLAVAASPSTLSAPAAISLQGFLCAGNTVSLEVPQTSETRTYQWTLPAGWQLLTGDGTHRISALVGSGGGQVSVAASNHCVTSPAASLQVQPLGLLAAGAISGPLAGCANTPAVYRLEALPGAKTYNWQVPAGWQVLSGQGSPEVRVLPGPTAGEVQVQIINDCGAGPASKLMVNPGLLPQAPAAITASAALPCSGEQEITFTVAPPAGAESYAWTVPASWLILSGQGSPSLTVKAGQTGGMVQVKAGNACGESPAASLQVLSSAPVPLPPGPISASSTVICQNQSALQFQVAPQAGAIRFDWQLPADWMIVSGAGTASISVTAGKMSGQVRVKAYSNCGVSAASELAVQPLSVNYLSLGAISGSSEVCAGQNNLIYTVAPLANAASYTWTVPAGWTITAGQGSERIQVQAGQQPGNVSVVAANSCSQSPAVTFAIAQVFPAPPPAILDLSSVCSGLVYTIDKTPDLVLPGSPARKPSYSWKVPAGWTIVEGQGSGRLKVLAPEGSEKGTISVIADNGNCLSEPITLEADPAIAESAVKIANAITANGDGHNDTWEIRNLEKYPENEVVIFNRWGNEVYRSKGYNNTWNGGDLLSGTYFYQLKVKVCDGTQKNYKGYVMLLR